MFNVCQYHRKFTWVWVQSAVSLLIWEQSLHLETYQVLNTICNLPLRNYNYIVNEPTESTKEIKHKNHVAWLTLMLYKTGKGAIQTQPSMGYMLTQSSDHECKASFHNSTYTKTHLLEFSTFSWLPCTCLSYLSSFQACWALSWVNIY